jgi:hypothetical protein
MKLYIGIDPGRKGGIASITKHGVIFRARALKTNNYRCKSVMLEQICNGLHKALPMNVLVEKPRVWPGKPMQNLTKLIRDAGIWEGWCQSYGMQVYCKTPKEWQEPFRTMPIWRCLSASNATRGKAYRSFATVKEIFGKKEAEKHCLGPKGGILDGVADAILMAYYLYLRKGRAK